MQIVSGKVAEISRQTMKKFYGPGFDALVGTASAFVKTPAALVFVAVFSRSARLRSK
jgi:hypothetical protein